MSGSDPLDLIEEGCYLCLRLGLRVSNVPANCVAVSDGIYTLSEDARQYHPLESVLVGVEASSGDWRADAATALGVTVEWIEGFVDGFAQGAERSRDQEYVQGFLNAEELLARRFRRVTRREE